MSYAITYHYLRGFEFHPTLTGLTGRVWRTHAPVRKMIDSQLEQLYNTYIVESDRIPPPPLWGNCIEWAGPTRFNRLDEEKPFIKLGPKEYSVIRLSLALKFGVEYDTLPVPGLKARCGTNLCVNPEHLAPRGKYEKRVKRERIETTTPTTTEDEDDVYRRPTPLELDKNFKRDLEAMRKSTSTFATADDILKTSSATPNEEIDFEALRAAVQLTPEMVAKKEERKREMEQAEKEARLEVERAKLERRERRRQDKVSIKDLISEEENRTKQAMKEIDERNAAIRKQVEDLANGAPLTEEGIELATDLLSNVEKKETGEQ
jgi:hypothetical protein